MELRQVEYFLAIIDHHSLKKAAAALGVAQPTVSQGLRTLERELEVQLFHRIGRGMVLTAAGRSLIGPCRQLLRDAATAEHLFSASTDVVTGRLDIFTWPGLAGGPIVDLLVRYRRRYPRVTVRYSSFRQEDQAAVLIRDGHCEFVVAHLRLPTGKDLETIELGEQEYWLAYPTGTDLPSGPISLAQMPDVPMVFAPVGAAMVAAMVDAVETALRQAGARPTPSVLVDQREVRLPMVAAGLGGTFVDSTHIDPDDDSIVARPCRPRLALPYGLIFDPEVLTPVGQAFIELVKSSHIPSER
jgi:DNA-binding transcriptional LysR family regulator